ncbi:hypothetical protein DVH24_012155 [Malus domestica]|uniref:Uncharacterized protein n=1 Tax=Malus domestica TaxID=3750 RepID=A0A498HTL0_MALDO|nr:hypothetical protein DVH24_012155 [Malus domestica]
MEGVHEAPHYIENPKDPLQEELDNLSTLSPSRCIYRVPNRLRRVNEKAYTPQVVSIGPLHHGKEHLKAMEEHKKRYLRHFLSRTRERVSFSDYIQMIKDQEGRLRGSYAEPIEFGSDQFVRIVLVDAAFVIEFLLRCRDSHCEGDDYIFNNPMLRWDVRPDLGLLENQLPFFILQVLFNTLSSSAHPRPSLLEISYYFFVSQVVRKGKAEAFYEKYYTEVEVQHFVDLIRILYRPLKSKTRRELKTTAVPNAAELLQAGVKFTVGKGSNIFDIKFSDGILEIPTLIVADTTDLAIRNLLAFEQCHKRGEDCLTSYVFLMKRLAKTPKDVELLVEHGIIENWLGSTKKISTLLHDLGTGMILDHYCYAPLCENLNSYCRTRRHKWMANLRQNYFNTPWSIISVVAAVILLLLTFIQTVCTVISVA